MCLESVMKILMSWYIWHVQPSPALVQVEVIELYNDGSGLGFGIIGSKGIGVIIKTIIPGGVSARVSVVVLYCNSTLSLLTVIFTVLKHTRCSRLLMNIVIRAYLFYIFDTFHNGVPVSPLHQFPHSFPVASC